MTLKIKMVKQKLRNTHKYNYVCYPPGTAQGISQVRELVKIHDEIEFDDLHSLFLNILEFDEPVPFRSKGSEFLNKIIRGGGFTEYIRNLE